ncbi:hypothetical protein [uncultured Roseobacter sp.]|uniref:hypothetical protein n=1 Tax=uncultured Roseobacter sp. TaxID=114847 RepID=UPI002635BE77|nr:hypothetical protein [uncultured Roseobacter sp.]
MTEFLSVLLLYYGCDAAAETRALNHAEVMECMAHYQQVKEYFTEPEANGAERSQSAYQNFKAWEHRNAETVADLRRTASR